MARIAGVDIPRNKRVEVSLTYIFGIGRSTSNKILGATGIDRDTKVKDLTEEQVDTVQTSTEGSSRESCTMGESLMQQRRVNDEGLRIVKFCCRGR